MATHRDLLAPPPDTRLPENPQAVALSAGGADARAVAAAHPDYSVAWADLAEQALAGDDAVAAYAFARTGYHRGLDALRRNGWGGHGPVPWSHEPNRGVLRSFYLLAQAAQRIGETDEYDRLINLINDSDSSALEALGG